MKPFITGQKFLQTPKLLYGLVMNLLKIMEIQVIFNQIVSSQQHFIRPILVALSTSFDIPCNHLEIAY